jgi:hypothetical protein
MGDVKQAGFRDLRLLEPELDRVKAAYKQMKAEFGASMPRSSFMTADSKCGRDVSETTQRGGSPSLGALPAAKLLNR